MLALVLTIVVCGVHAQRKTDPLGRGLVAVKLADNGNGIGTHVSWRRLGTEYYDVTYNLYYNGSLLASGLTNTNYTHTHAITGSETYQVAAVVRGVTQERCASVTVWPGWQMYRNGDRYVGGYLDIPLGEVFSRSNTNVTNSYWPNDIEVADLDGDGEMEFIVKRMNMDDANNLYVDMTDKAYDVIEAYEFDGTRLWWIDVGANMVSANSTETNVIAFDWDEDGAAEVVLRGADDMVIHYMENGQERTQNIGTYGLSTRNTVTHSANATFTNTGNEYLIYLNGATGKPYNIGYNNEPWMTYPLPRLENGETSEQAAWGTGLLGHRSSKYFMGAPYLDGRKPFLFLGRGIYTRHKMMALRLDKGSHKWYTHWAWACNNSNSPWWGQGYHNFLIADVDEDGRDEIVYGSMVIDDNGSGLHTTGYGHGDAQHVSDFDPWSKGLEFFGCLEEYPYWGVNLRNATTGDIYYKYTSPKTTYNPETENKYVRDENGNLITDRDDGRALMANFSNDYPGSLGRSANSDVMSSTTRALVGDLSGFLPAGNLNFRIYWDGDLLSEWQDSPGKENDLISINKPGLGRIFNATDTKANNSTKHNTCFQGDIIGDWREEFIARVDERTVRIYTTGIYSDYSFPTLWHDHQYRQAMATQQMVYNLPPNVSFFLGELEGYTVAPPPQTTTERTEIMNGGRITSAHNGLQVIACQTEDNMTITVEDGAAPWVFTDNAPSRVQGSDLNGQTGTRSNDYTGALGIVESSRPSINRSYYTHTVTGGAFTGAMHLTKQGDGTLILPNVTETYTGNTKVWAGTLVFDGTMQNSLVWMNRHTTLNTAGGQFLGGLTMEYGATLNVGGATTGTLSTTTAPTLELRYGARVVLDVNGSEENEHDWLNAATLTLDTDKASDAKWTTYGPEYVVPVFELHLDGVLADGLYPIGHVTTINGDLTKVKLECSDMDANHLALVHEDGVLYLQVSDSPTTETNEAVIAITDMVSYTPNANDYPSASEGSYYLPKVSVTATLTDGRLPTLSGTFTSAIDGTVTTLEGNLDSYTFREPGSLEVKSKLSGYAASKVTFDALWPYVKLYESPDFSTIAAADAASTLGSDLWGESFTSRHANWSKNNATYPGESNYVMANSKEVNTPIYIDSDHFLWADRNAGVALTLVQDFGITQNRNNGPTFHAANLGDENTIIHHIYDLSRGGAENYIDEYIHASADGSYSYNMGINGCLQKFIAYVPVCIHDELATALPETVSTTGNAHVWRNGLQGASTWATLVVPFDMTAAQARETFGENTTVARLVTTKGSTSEIYFETTKVSEADDATVVITKNEPCLVSGVTKAAPYLVMGITSEPVGDPQVASEYFRFVGTYTNLGQQPFYLTDYFFTASGLSRVSRDGLMMTLKGYRGYFQILSANGAKSIQTVFDAPDVATGFESPAIFFDQDKEVYDLQGRKMPQSQWQNGTLRKGVYIVGNRKIIVK